MRTRISLLLLAAALTGGCANYTQPVVQPKLTPEQQNFEAVWLGVQEVLADYYFKIDLEDRRDGVMRTLPLTGEYAFEFWRHDAASNYNLWEGSIQTVYRTATVTVRPSEKFKGQFVTSVEVQTTRSDRPSRSMLSDHQIYKMFIISDTEQQSDQFLLRHEYADNPRAVLVPLGRDKSLEAKLQADIEARLVGRQRIVR